MHVRLADGCGGHRMERVEAWWTQAMCMAAWRFIPFPRERARQRGWSCHLTSQGNGRKASSRTRFSSTNLGALCARIQARTTTRWCLLTRILPPAGRNRGSCPVVYAPLPFPCHRKTKLLGQSLRQFLMKGCMRVGFRSNHAPDSVFLSPW
jgi:hypothetical protein